MTSKSTLLLILRLDTLLLILSLTLTLSLSLSLSLNLSQSLSLTHTYTLHLTCHQLQVFTECVDSVRCTPAPWPAGILLLCHVCPKSVPSSGAGNAPLLSDNNYHYAVNAEINLGQVLGSYNMPSILRL